MALQKLQYYQIEEHLLNILYGSYEFLLCMCIHWVNLKRIIFEIINFNCTTAIFMGCPVDVYFTFTVYKCLHGSYTVNYLNLNSSNHLFNCNHNIFDYLKFIKFSPHKMFKFQITSDFTTWIIH